MLIKPGRAMCFECHDDFLEKANRGGADTLLMGAYRHGLFLETVFGGATKTVMDHTSLPVFLSH